VKGGLELDFEEDRRVKAAGSLSLSPSIGFRFRNISFIRRSVSVNPRLTLNIIRESPETTHTRRWEILDDPGSRISLSRTRQRVLRLLPQSGSFAKQNRSTEINSRARARAIMKLPRTSIIRATSRPARELIASSPREHGG